MFPVPDNPIYVIDGDGRTQPFDAEQLQQTLAAAFAAAGDPDGYLAEDIVLTVESAMLKAARSGRTFARSEVDAAVIRILENAGCAETARVFGRTGSRLRIEIAPTVAGIQVLLERHLGLGESPAQQVACDVVRAAEKLGLPALSPGLCLELARCYEQLRAEPVWRETAMPAATSGRAGRFLLSPAEVEESLAGEARRLSERGILKLAGVNRLYPNLKLSLNLALLTEDAALAPPVTELAFHRALFLAGEAAETALQAVRGRLPGMELPLYLKLPELERFVREKLDADYPAGKAEALDMLNDFRAALSVPVRRVYTRR